MKDVVVRLAGAGLLCVCASAGYWLHQLVGHVPPHEVTFGQLALALATFLTFGSGMAALIHGAALFLPSYPPPARWRAPLEQLHE